MPVEFRVKYDGAADTLYIRLKSGRIVESDEIAPGMIVDLSKDSEIVVSRSCRPLNAN